MHELEDMNSESCQERVKEVCSVEQMKAAGEALDLKEQNASAATRDAFTGES